MTGRALLAILLALFWLPVCVARAGVLRYCDPPATLSAQQNDKLYRLAGLIRTELESSGQRLALIARSGLDLSRFGIRYSHAGLSLKENPANAWAIRQLYYDCDAQTPRIFDQGISAFLLGLANASAGFISVVLMPEAQAHTLEAAALDNRQALQLLNHRYSANAHAFSVEYQNCNQWLAELMASAWSPTSAPGPQTLGPQTLGPQTTGEGTQARLHAQSWLRQHHYTPTVFEIAWRPILWFAALIPWVHLDDHPAEDLEQKQLRVSMPASIETLVRTMAPESTRIEFCHTAHHVVIRRGWEPIDEGCQPTSQDTVVTLD